MENYAVKKEKHVKIKNKRRTTKILLSSDDITI